MCIDRPKINIKIGAMQVNIYLLLPNNKLSQIKRTLKNKTGILYEILPESFVMKKFLFCLATCLALHSCDSKQREESAVDSTEVTLEGEEIPVDSASVDTVSVDSTSASPGEEEEPQEEVFYCSNHTPSHAANSSQLASFKKENGCTGFKSGK